MLKWIVGSALNNPKTNKRKRKKAKCHEWVIQHFHTRGHVAVCDMANNNGWTVMINDGECWGEHHDSPPSPSSLFTWDAGPRCRQRCGNQQQCTITTNAGQWQQQQIKTTWHVNRRATSSKRWQCMLSSLFTLVKVSDPPPPFLFSHKRQAMWQWTNDG